MANFAVISNNTVMNIIVAETQADAELVTNATCVEYTTENPAAIGDIYDAENDTFTTPVSVEQPESN